MWTEVTKKTEADLQGFAALFIGGGNTFKLLSTCKRTGFDQLLLSFLKHGGIVYGGSAGAIIIGKDIRTASRFDLNEVGLEDPTGLDLLGGASLWCHYRAEDEQHVRMHMATYQHPIIALSERVGLFVQENRMMVVGFEPMIVFGRHGSRPFLLSSPVIVA